MGRSDLDLAVDLLLALGEIDLARACGAEPDPTSDDWRRLENR